MTDYPDSAFTGVLRQARDLPKTQILVLGLVYKALMVSLNDF